MELIPRLARPGRGILAAALIGLSLPGTSAAIDLGLDSTGAPVDLTVSALEASFIGTGLTGDLTIVGTATSVGILDGTSLSSPTTYFPVTFELTAVIAPLGGGGDYTASSATLTFSGDHMGGPGPAPTLSLSATDLLAFGNGGVLGGDILEFVFAFDTPAPLFGDQVNVTFVAESDLSFATGFTDVGGTADLFVPEPATAGLLAAALLGVGVAARRRRGT